MKVTVKNSEKMNVEDVPFGEIILLGNKYYMVIDSTDLNSLDDVSVLDLSNYSSFTIDAETKVTRVPAELVIG